MLLWANKHPILQTPGFAQVPIKRLPCRKRHPFALSASFAPLRETDFRSLDNADGQASG